MTLSTAKCRFSGCNHLQSKKVETARGHRVSWYCEITGRIPGNMGKCPLEDGK